MFLFVVLIDQTTKYLVMSKLPLGDSFIIINDFIYLSPVQNRGITLGAFQKSWYFYSILILVILCAFFCYVTKSKNTYLKLSSTLIAGGFIGNLIDFFLKGSVIDFLNIKILSLTFPNTNFADIFIVAGITVFITHFINKES